MALANFQKAYARVRVYEGGNVDDPQDPGGRTSRGVTQRVYTAWCKRQGKPTGDVWRAPEASIASIYKELYWDRCSGDRLPDGVDFVVFDAAVNSGVGQASKWMQRALKNYAGLMNGDFGAVTVQAVLEDEDNDALIARYCALRLGMLHSLKMWSRFGKGWSARVANVQKIGQAWATGSVGPHPVMVESAGGNAKAVVEPETIKRPIISTSTAAVATSATTVSTVAADLGTQFQPFNELFFWMPYVLGGLTLTAAIAGLIVKISHNKAESAERSEVTHVVDLAADRDMPVIKVDEKAQEYPDGMPEFLKAPQPVVTSQDPVPSNPLNLDTDPKIIPASPITSDTVSLEGRPEPLPEPRPDPVPVPPAPVQGTTPVSSVSALGQGVFVKPEGAN